MSHMLQSAVVSFAGCLSLICGGASVWRLHKMVKEVNKRLVQNRFQLPLWRTEDQAELYKEYQRLNQGASGHKHIMCLVAAGWVFFIVFIFSFWKVYL